MVLLALFAAAAGAPPAAEAAPPRPIAVAAQSTAMVRIISGERISAASLPATAIVSDTKVRGVDGIDKPARLVEFP